MRLCAANLSGSHSNASRVKSNEMYCWIGTMRQNSRHCVFQNGAVTTYLYIKLPPKWRAIVSASLVATLLCVQTAVQSYVSQIYLNLLSGCYYFSLVPCVIWNDLMYLISCFTAKLLASCWSEYFVSACVVLTQKWGPIPETVQRSGKRTVCCFSKRHHMTSSGDVITWRRRHRVTSRLTWWRHQITLSGESSRDNAVILVHSNYNPKLSCLQLVCKSYFTNYLTQFTLKNWIRSIRHLRSAEGVEEWACMLHLRTLACARGVYVAWGVGACLTSATASLYINFYKKEWRRIFFFVYMSHRLQECFISIAKCIRPRWKKSNHRRHLWDKITHTHTQIFCESCSCINVGVVCSCFYFANYVWNLFCWELPAMLFIAVIACSLTPEFMIHPLLFLLLIYASTFIIS